MNLAKGDVSTCSPDSAHIGAGINWRLLYDWKAEQRAEKMRKTGAMLREMQQREEGARSAHAVQASPFFSSLSLGTIVVICCVHPSCPGRNSRIGMYPGAAIREAPSERQYSTTETIKLL